MDSQTIVEVPSASGVRSSEEIRGADTITKDWSAKED
jgi:hypothetical protein